MSSRPDPAGKKAPSLFEQIKEKACTDEQVIQTANANPLDKFELGIRSLIESLMIQRLEENDWIVSRYMDDPAFQNTVFRRLPPHNQNSNRRKTCQRLAGLS